jgi:DNA repair exonuclease SbcCD ATPase subunit
MRRRFDLASLAAGGYRPAACRSIGKGILSGGLVVSQSRNDRQSPLLPGTPILSELLRQSTEPAKEASEGKDEGKMPVFWRVFGGTVLSIAALVMMTAYQSLNGGIADMRSDIGRLDAEMRKDVGRLNDTQGDLVKKEEMNSRLQLVWTSIRELQDDRKDLITLKERCQAVAGMVQEGQRQRDQLSQEIQRLREQQAADEERRALVKELGQLRERLAGLEAQKANVKHALDHPTSR